MLSNLTLSGLLIAGSLASPCSAGDPYADIIQKLDRLARLPRLSSELKDRVIASLPKEGEIRTLSPERGRKLQSAAPVLKAHGRESDYLFKVVESRQARLAIYARMVILVTDTALDLLTPAQFQSMVAHEIGHEYVWDEYEGAKNAGDWRRIRELELVCDAVAVQTLVRLGTPGSALVDALLTMEASDRRNGILWEKTRKSHPSTSERSRFAREITKRLAAVSIAAR